MAVGAAVALGSTGLAEARLGLYRLKIWGLVANAATNVVIADGFDLPRGVAPMFVATALLQLVVPLPIAHAAVTGKPARPWLGPAGGDWW